MSFIYNIDVFSDTLMPCLPLGVCFYRLKFKHPGPLGLLFTYLLLSFVLFGLSNYLADRKMNNLFIYNAFPLIEVFLVAALLHNANRNKFQRIGIAASAAIVLWFVLKIVTVGINHKFIASIALMADLIIAVLCIACLYKILTDQLPGNTGTGFLYWICITFLLYAAGSFMVHAVYALNAGKGKTFTAQIWLVNDALLIVKYLMLVKCIFEFRIKKTHVGTLQLAHPN